MKVYLDNNATTKMSPEVLDVMMPFLTVDYANPSSFHTLGDDLKEHIEKARDNVAELVGADAEEIIFTSGGTESDNTALISGVDLDPERPGVVTSAVEHPAVLETVKYLKDTGYPAGVAEVDNRGILNLDSLRSLVTGRTGIVSIMAANNETGVLMPIGEAASVAHDSGALFHTDAVQAVGKIPMDVKRDGIDLLSLSAHKLHGPKGVGALFVRSGVKLKPFMHGGHQENSMRSGTYNIAGIAGLGKAAELAKKVISNEMERTSALLGKLEDGVISSCPGAVVVAADAPRLPNTATILFTVVESEAILTLLDYAGVYVSSGSACSTGSKDPSSVLTAMGVSVGDANTAIRFSLSRYTTEEEIDYVLEVLPPLVEKLRSISPFNK